MYLRQLPTTASGKVMETYRGYCYRSFSFCFVALVAFLQRIIILVNYLPSVFITLVQQYNTLPPFYKLHY